MDNTTRTLKQALSVDGWIGDFDDNGVASVHVDVVFRQGGFGEDPTSAIRFKIALTRAEIVVRVPNQAPLRIVKRSVKRTANAATGIRTESAKREGFLKGSVKAALAKTPFVSADGEASVSRTNSSDAQLQEAISRHFEQHFTTEDGHIAWEVEANPEFAPHLAGSPWNAENAPRLNVSKFSNRNAEGDPPSVIIEIRCCREDIEIIDLEEKDPEAQNMWRTKKNKSVNLAAAEQVIKDELFKAGFLEVPDLSEKQSRLLIADTIIFEDK